MSDPARNYPAMNFPIFHETEPQDNQDLVDREDDHDDTADSAFGDSRSSMSTTASLTESILDYRNLHGRTYQRSASTTYWGPNDPKQLEGLDLTHHWMTLLLDGRLYLSPIKDTVQRILDVGTGTGNWAIDVADAFPGCEVIGTDISPVQPSWVPPNCRFLIDDAQRSWGWGPDHFDFIHLRHLTGCIDDWRRLYAQAFSRLRPGGYLEHCEYDIHTRSDTGLVQPGHVFHTFADLMFEASRRNGRSFELPASGEAGGALMEEVGFVDVVHRSWKVPIGGWAADDKKMREVGLFTEAFVDASVEGFALWLLKEMLDWEYDDIQALVESMRRALKRAKYKPYFILHTTYAKKPL